MSPPLMVSLVLSLCLSTVCEQKVFAFVLIDNFLAYTFAGAVLTKIDLLEHLAGHPVEIIDLLATTLPAQSTFFMNLIMIAAFNGLTMELLRYDSFHIYTIGHVGQTCMHSYSLSLLSGWITFRHTGGVC